MRCSSDSVNRRSPDAPEWFPDWSGQTVVIVASGPTASQAPLSLAKGKARFVVINSSWKLAPWADVLYACDYAWWAQHGGVPAFSGLKVSIDGRAASMPEWNIRHLLSNRGDDRIVLNESGRVGWGGNSGMHAFNFSVQTCPSKIILVGFDMTIKYGLHWHGKHDGNLNNPSPNNIGRWIKALDAAAGTVASVGVKVFNCSHVSELKKYPKMFFEDALEA